MKTIRFETESTSKALITLINPNKVQPAITPYALDILTTSLEQDGFAVEVVDLTFRQETWKQVLEEYFQVKRPLLIGITIRNTDTIYPQEQKVFLEEHKEVIDIVKQLTKAPIVAGGVGFSSMPFALLEYFDIPYGIKGPGELLICKLANKLLLQESPWDVSGLLINDGQKVVQVSRNNRNESDRHLKGSEKGRVKFVNLATPYVRRSGVPWKVDNLEYYAKGGLGNILIKNGCSFACAHCVEPDAKGKQFARRSITAVVDEMEMLAGQGVYDLHTSDSEVNLSIENTKNILRAIIARKRKDSSSPLHQLRLWIYAQPVPFDEELALLLAKAGCKGVNLSPEHTRDELLNSWKVAVNEKRYFNFEDIKRVTKLIKDNGMLVIIDIMLGMPGETIETVYDCIDETLALDATVVGFALGIRVFPYSPLGVRFANESNGITVIKGLQSNTAISPIILRPLASSTSIADYERQFMFDEFGRIRPLFYFSPDLPEDPKTIDSPSGRWSRTIELIRSYVPQNEHYRVSLPTIPGDTKDDNNYADNPFLMRLVQLGYKGAYWSNWRRRDQIMLEFAEREKEMKISNVSPMVE